MTKRKRSKGDRGAVSDLLRVDAGSVDLATMPVEAVPGLKVTRTAAKAESALLADRLADLQTRLLVAGHNGGSRSLLLVLQGMDASGKTGAIKSVAWRTNPLGLRIVAFGHPTAEELAHDFLWRIRREVPEPGQLAVFDRSHYEDVVAGPVRGDIGQEVLAARYSAINAFERELTDAGTAVVKCFLHISREEQRRRLLARLDDPAKVWKFTSEDLDDRVLWGDFLAAYTRAIR
jgi:polyphosphate kinase 2 (PPK2 family)